MSDRSHVVPAPEGEYFESSRFAGLSLSARRRSASSAWSLSVIGAFISPVQFSFSWLFAFAFFFTLCVGCLFGPSFITSPMRSGRSSSGGSSKTSRRFFR